MNLRFSRSSLNLIIFGCIILIGWASIDKNRSSEAITNPVINKDIPLPQLAELNYQTWSSREGVQVLWQSRLDTDFHIRIRGVLNSDSVDSDTSATDSTLISWQPNYWQWDLNLGASFEQGLPLLSQKLQNFPAELKQQTAAIVLQGPWSNDIAKLTGARIINSLQLKSIQAQPFQTEPLQVKSADSQNNSARICPWQPISAQFWLQDQLSNKHLSQPNMSQKHWRVSQWPQLASVDARSLHAWKQTFIQQWQLNWQNPAMQFDMLSDLAYYRLPQNYLLQGYWGINTLDVAQLEDYLSQCQASEPALHASEK